MPISYGPNDLPVLFSDLPEEAFPVRIQAFLGEELLWERVVEPYVATSIPGAGENEGRVRMRFEYGNGLVHWAEPGIDGAHEEFDTFGGELGEEVE